MWCGGRVVVFLGSCGRLLGVVWAESGVERRAVSYRFSCRSAGLGPFYGSVSALGLCGRSLGLFFFVSLGAGWGPFRGRSAVPTPRRARATNFTAESALRTQIGPPKRPRTKKNAEAATRATSTRKIKKHEGKRATRDDQGAQAPTTRKAPRKRLEAHRGPREPTAGCRRPTGSTRGELARSAVWAPPGRF